MQQIWGRRRVFHFSFTKIFKKSLIFRIVINPETNKKNPKPNLEMVERTDLEM